MAVPSSPEVTRLLLAWSQAERARSALECTLNWVVFAHHYMSVNEEVTLGIPRALANNAHLRLVDSNGVLAESDLLPRRLCPINAMHPRDWARSQQYLKRGESSKSVIGWSSDAIESAAAGFVDAG